jgi:DHA1 family inner membrane transport protein
MLSAFAFNTTENLPIGILGLIAGDLRVSLAAVGYLISGYGLVVALASLPLAQLTRRIPRRWVLSAVLAVLVVGSLAPAFVASYGVLIGARVVTALAQALFWAVMGPVAVGLFPPSVRGRVMGLLAVGGSLATVLGVPAGNWLGRQAGWQLPFLIVGGLGLLAGAVIGLLLPAAPPEASHAAYGAEPDRRRFAGVLVITGLSVTGVFTCFTYVVSFLQDVTGFSPDAVSVLLGVFGLGGFLGVLALGPLLDRFPFGTLAFPVVLQAVALLAFWVGAEVKAVVAVALGALGIAVAQVFVATQSRALRVAPGRTEIALASNSAAFNVGVALGALAGGLLLHALTVRGLFLFGAVLSAAALAGLWLNRPDPRTSGGALGLDSARTAPGTF